MADKKEIGLFYSKAAEAGVLGSMIIDPACIEQVLDIVDADSFYFLEHQLIFKTLLELYSADGGAVDGLLVREALDKSNHLKEIGGVEYLAKVMESVPSSANAEYYAKIVKEKAKQRKLNDVGDKIKEAIKSTDSVDENVWKVQQIAAGLDGAFEPSGNSEPIIKTLSDVEPLPIHWFWYNRIPSGMLTILQGDPGLGKSFLSLYMAEKVSTGGAWPDDGTPDNFAPRGSVVILSAEDDLAHVIRPRLDSLGADVSKIFALEGIKVIDENDCSQQEYFNLQRDISALRQAIQNQKDTKLVIIDPLSAYLGHRIDSHKDTDVRSVLAPLVGLAEEFDIAVVAIRHLNKSGGGKAIYRGLGSIAFTAAARTVWLLTTDPDDRQSRRRLLTPAKHNILIEPSGLAFELIDGKVNFEDEPVTTSSDEALQTTTVIAIEKDRAVEWLKELLPPGKSLASTEVTEQAKKQDISDRTLRRAKREAGVTSFRLQDGEQGRWFWQIE